MQNSVLFWTAFAAIGQAVGAIATASAVIVSLWIALSERKAKIKVQAGLRLIIAGDGSPATDTISISVTNEGMRRVRVSSIGWRTGWFRFGPSWLKQQFAFQNPTDIVGSSNPPFDLDPGQEKTILLNVTAFANANADRMRIQFFNRKFPFRDNPVPAKVDVVVSLVAAKAVFARVERGLEWYLAKGKFMKGTGAANFNERARASREPEPRR